MQYFFRPAVQEHFPVAAVTIMNAGSIFQQASLINVMYITSCVLFDTLIQKAPFIVCRSIIS